MRANEFAQYRALDRRHRFDQSPENIFVLSRHLGNRIDRRENETGFFFGQVRHDRRDRRFWIEIFPEMTVEDHEPAVFEFPGQNSVDVPDGGENGGERFALTLRVLPPVIGMSQEIAGADVTDLFDSDTRLAHRTPFMIFDVSLAAGGTRPPSGRTRPRARTC